MIRKCLVCGSAVSPMTSFDRVALLNKPVSAHLDDMVTSMEVCCCTSCDHISTYLGEDISHGDLLEKIYGELYSKMTQTTISKTQSAFTENVLRIVRKWIGGKGVRVLEIGCHDGYIIGNLAKDGHFCVGVEPSVYADFASATYPDVRIHKGFFDRNTFADEKFDLILARHVVEHVRDPLDFMKAISDRLAPGGLVYVEVPSSLDSVKKCYYPEFHVDHISYFTPRSFNTLHKLAGLGDIKFFEVFDSYLNFPFMGILSAKSSGLDGVAHEYFHSSQMPLYIEKFNLNFRKYRQRLIDIFSAGSVGIWGAGSVANRYILDSGASLESYHVFDINKANFGFHLSVSGAEVFDARMIPEMEIKRILIASSWEEDVRRQIREISDSIDVIGYSQLIA